jgi:hypothetical protein
MKSRCLLLLSAVCAVALVALGATSTAWELSGFNELLKGRLTGLSLDANGRLEPGPSVRWTASLGQPAVWAVAAAPDGSIYAATGHSGKVFRVTADGKSSLVWTASQSEVFALAVDPRGQVYAATSPNGGLYRLQNGGAQEVWHTAAKYIWSLAFASDGILYLGTGDGGRVYRYDGKSAPTVYYETGQSNVTALLAAPGHLYAGTDPNGLLYDIAGPGRATVVYDSSLPEIRSIALAQDGTLYAAAMGGAVASRSAAAGTVQPASATAVASAPTVITVTASADAADAGDQAVKPAEQSKPATSTATSATAASGGITEVSGVEKSAIYRIRSNGSVETIRSSKDDNVYSLLLDGDSLLISTDDHGRIYRYLQNRISLLAEPGSGETTQLLKIGSDLYAAVSNSARLMRFGTAGSAPAIYESQVHDASSVARWGHLQWHGTGSGVVFRTRTGYSARPDNTWSPWSAPLTTASGSLIPSPPARFVQFRGEWPAGADARIDSIALPYLAQNSAPAVRSLTVSSIVGTNAAKTGAASTPSSSTAAYSITVTDTGEAPAASSSNSASQIVSRLQTTQTQISWQADDPDGDKLVYSIYFRAEDENGWQLIRSHMFENTLLLDPDVFADGRYFFRVLASDSPANAPEFAHDTELVSTPVVIDNTPPVVTVVSSGRTDVEIEAADKTSPLRLCEYTLDAGTWQPIESVDGITDSPQERFRVHLAKLSPGEHLLVFRVYDTAGNAGLAKVVLR